MEEVQDNDKCTSPGCPMHGSVTSSTSGGGWVCWLHFSNPRDSANITAALRRNMWLVVYAQRVRAGISSKKDDFTKIETVMMRDGKKEFTRLNDKPLFNKQGEKIGTRQETGYEWAVRLDEALRLLSV